jgi:hypothetical protein
MRGRTGRAVALALVLALVVGFIVTRAVESADSAIVTSTLTPIADTYVQSDTPTVNYGTASRIPVDASPVRLIYTRFDLSGLDAPVQSAKLRVHVSSVADSQSPSGGSVALVNDNTWTETGMTYANRPTDWSPNIQTLGAVNRNTWYEMDVASAITPGGQLTLGMRSTNVDGAFYDTREAATLAPQLVVVTGSDDPTTSSSSTSTSSTTTTTTPTVTNTVVPTADTFVQSDTATTNYGTVSRIPVDSSPVRQIFMRFDLSALSGPVQAATLRLHVSSLADSQSPSGGSVALVSNNTWTETGMTYNNRPTSWGANIQTLGAVNRNTWYELNVTSAITSGGALTLGLRSTNGDGAFYDSREAGALAPQLVVTTGTPTTTTTSSSTTTSTSTTTTTTTPPQPGDVFIAAAGDISCRNGLGTNATQCRQLQVSNIIVNDPSITTFLALGDLQYESGELANFQGNYDASYGRIKAITKPTPGNHEYATTGASGYYTYFGAQAGDPTKGYYSFDVGSTWHIAMLNGNCGIVSCAASSTQTQWLAADLAANTRPCVIGAWHQPRWSSGMEHGNDTHFGPFWDVLQANNAELVLNGHEHTYERFAPMLPSGVASPNGIEEIVVGTGGRSLYTFAAAQPNSLTRLATFGILKLRLGANDYSYQFIGQDGTVFDSGSGVCH